jgi:hypothetical protein
MVMTTHQLAFHARDVAEGSQNVSIIGRTELDAAQIIWPASSEDLRARSRSRSHRCLTRSRRLPT